MTLPLDTLRGLKQAIIHKNCPDGLASAMILRDVFPEIDCYFVQYNTKEHRELEVRPGQIFADFSPHRDRVKEFLVGGAIVLDHHSKAWNVSKPFVEAGQGVFGKEETDPGVSGALLTFREVWLPLIGDTASELRRRAIEELATLAGVYDTWQTKSPLWEQAREQAQALEFWHWKHCLPLPWNQWQDKILNIGPALRKKTDARLKMLLGGGSRFTTSKGRKVIMFEGISESSLAAEKVDKDPDEDADLIIGFGIFNERGNTTPNLYLSCRSPRGFDVGALALAHGGGGHSAAAGFNVPLKRNSLQPFTISEDLLNAYEKHEEKWLRVVEYRKDDPSFQPEEEYRKIGRHF
jgi:hypothetical protein